MGGGSLRRREEFTVIGLLAILLGSTCLLGWMAARYLYVHEAIFNLAITVSEVVVEELTTENATVLVVLNMSNPSRINLTIRGLEFGLRLNHHYVGGFSHYGFKVVPSGGHLLIQSRVHISKYYVVHLLQAAEDGCWNWTIYGGVHLRTPLKDVTIMFTREYVAQGSG